MVLGKAYLGQNKLGLAQNEFGTMIRMQPDNPHGYFNLGIVKRLQKNNSEALENFEKALELDPKLLDVLSQAVSLEAGQGGLR